MKTNDLQAELIDWSVKHSGFDPERDYIGLSGIADCEQMIYDRLRSGQRASINEQLKTKISYELEGALVVRLMSIVNYELGESISLYNGLVQGHTDGLIEGREILEIKTLEKAAYFPANGLPSRRIQWQVQAYMHYLKRPWTHIVYLARDTGGIFCVGMKYDPALGGRIHAKVERLVKAVMKTDRPRCTCGRCTGTAIPVVTEGVKIVGQDR